jgi:hypothetical protein
MLFVSPELSCKLGQWVLGLAVPMTVYADMGGSQPAEDYRLVGKVAVQF